MEFDETMQILRLRWQAVVDQLTETYWNVVQDLMEQKIADARAELCEVFQALEA